MGVRFGAVVGVSCGLLAGNGGVARAASVPKIPAVTETTGPYPELRPEVMLARGCYEIKQDGAATAVGRIRAMWHEKTDAAGRAYGVLVMHEVVTSSYSKDKPFTIEKLATCDANLQWPVTTLKKDGAYVCAEAVEANANLEQPVWRFCGSGGLAGPGGPQGYDGIGLVFQGDKALGIAYSTEVPNSSGVRMSVAAKAPYDPSAKTRTQVKALPTATTLTQRAAVYELLKPLFTVFGTYAVSCRKCTAELNGACATVDWTGCTNY